MSHKLLFGILASVLTITSQASFAQTIGTTVKADDTVRGSKAGKLAQNTKVVANERITANRTGLGHIQFNDGTKMVIGPGTRLRLDETVYNPNGSTFKKFALKTSAGAIRFISGNSGSSSYQIDTPTGTLGVRGTAFDMQHYRGRTYIMLVDGEVEFCTRLNRCETLTRKCSFVVASPSGRVSEPVLPRNSQFNRLDMERYFPLIFDQSPIVPDFRLNASTCASGSRFALENEPDGPDGIDTFGGFGSDPDPGEPEGDDPGGDDPSPGDPGPGDPDPGNPSPGDPSPGDPGGDDPGNRQ
ncbi:MAG: FecR domain-containing protein [Rhizobiaceae bacterium]|nr:FecR domain-containing protein [Rhizobiaceae bacterium]